MGNLGIYVDHNSLGDPSTLREVLKFRDAAKELKHNATFLFPKDIEMIKDMDGILIRALTDPLNICYIISQTAEYYGIPVIDDSNSIRICGDKINMYLHMIQENVPIPKTTFIPSRKINDRLIITLFDKHGCPLIIKDPSTSFSVGVEKVESVEQFKLVCRRFSQSSKYLVVQNFIKTDFDWRIGILNGKILYAAKYLIPSKTFKIQDIIDGAMVYGKVISFQLKDVPENVKKIAKNAGKAIGNGLYGVDLKELVGGEVIVVEVNDNPSLDGGEDLLYPDIYSKIIDFIMSKKNLHVSV